MWLVSSGLLMWLWHVLTVLTRLGCEFDKKNSLCLYLWFGGYPCDQVRSWLTSGVVLHLAVGQHPWIITPKAFQRDTRVLIIPKRYTRFWPTAMMAVAAEFCGFLASRRQWDCQYSRATWKNVGLRSEPNLSAPKNIDSQVKQNVHSFLQPLLAPSTPLPLSKTKQDTPPTTYHQPLASSSGLRSESFSSRYGFFVVRFTSSPQPSLGLGLGSGGRVNPARPANNSRVFWRFFLWPGQIALQSMVFGGVLWFVRFPWWFLRANLEDHLSPFVSAFALINISLLAKKEPPRLRLVSIILKPAAQHKHSSVSLKA